MKQYLRPIIGFILTLSTFNAQASTVVYEDFQKVTDDTVFTTPFEISAAGTYKADLVDFEFPYAFDILSLGITQGLEPLGIGFGTGSFTFNVANPGTLQAHLAAIPGPGGMGLFGLRIMAVPLPPAAILFFSGLFGLVFVGRRDKGPGVV